MDEITACEKLAEFFNIRWVEVLDGLGTLFVGLAASLIAYRQWRSSQEAVKVQKFDQRFEVFQRLDQIGEKFNYGVQKEFLDGLELNSFFREMIALSRKAKFLFDEEIRNLIVQMGHLVLTYATSEESAKEYFNKARIDDDIYEFYRKEAKQALNDRNAAKTQLNDLYLKLPEHFAPFMRYQE